MALGIEMDDERAPWQRDRWSVQQHEVFDWFASGRGNLVCRARAGTGKTTTIVEGISRAPERRVLLAAFNKTIAKELQGRVSAPVESKTLHSLGFSFLRQNWRVNVDEDGERARWLTDQVAPDAPRPMARLIRELHTRVRDVDPTVALDDHGAEIVETYGARFDLLPDEEWEQRGWTSARICHAAHAAMRLAMERTEIIDFADMIFLPIVHDWVRPRYDLVVVDEAQDMTIAQVTIALGACARDGRVCVVGDDRQAIYSFRGADADSLDRLRGELHARELGLNTTYRCPKRVVELAAQIVPDFRAADSAPEGEVVTMEHDKMLAEVRVGDFVLSRKNAPLVRVCMSLLRKNVRAQIRGNDIGKGITALVDRLAPDDAADLRAKLAAWATKEIARARKRLPEDVADERVANVLDQRGIVDAILDECDDSLSLFRMRLTTLFSDRSTVASVMCSSVHRAKGLEADVVYLLRDTFRTGSIEEDNLRYVAITRTKQRLVWVEGGV